MADERYMRSSVATGCGGREHPERDGNGQSQLAAQTTCRSGAVAIDMTMCFTSRWWAHIISLVPSFFCDFEDDNVPAVRARAVEFWNWRWPRLSTRVKAS